MELMSWIFSATSDLWRKFRCQREGKEMAFPMWRFISSSEFSAPMDKAPMDGTRQAFSGFPNSRNIGRLVWDTFQLNTLEEVSILAVSLSRNKKDGILINSSSNFNNYVCVCVLLKLQYLGRQVQMR